MIVTINGEQRQLSSGLNLIQLLQELKINHATVAVELNLTIIPRGQYDHTILKDGDKLEIISLVGGG